MNDTLSLTLHVLCLPVLCCLSVLLFSSLSFIRPISAHSRWDSLVNILYPLHPVSSLLRRPIMAGGALCTFPSSPIPYTLLH